MLFKDLKVLVADNNFLIRAGIRSVLTENVGALNLSEASSLREIEQCAVSDGLRPKILIMNLSIDSSHLEFLRDFSARYPGISIIALGGASEEAAAARVLRAGALGYLRVHCSAEELMAAINAVGKGQLYLNSKSSEVVCMQLQKKADPFSHVSLSDREYQIFVLICKGQPLTDIGKTFGISVKTISTYRARILKKMGKTSNAELIQYAVRLEIIGSAVA